MKFAACSRQIGSSHENNVSAELCVTVTEKIVNSNLYKRLVNSMLDMLMANYTDIEHCVVSVVVAVVVIVDKTLQAVIECCPVASIVAAAALLLLLLFFCGWCFLLLSLLLLIMLCLR